MGSTPQQDATKKAKRAMQKAVDKVIDEKKEEDIGTKEALTDVAAHLHAAAQEDTGKGGQEHREKGGSGAGSRKPLESSVPRVITPSASACFSEPVSTTVILCHAVRAGAHAH